MGTLQKFYTFEVLGPSLALEIIPFVAYKWLWEGSNCGVFVRDTPAS
jgi:hypothetical protein